MEYERLKENIETLCTHNERHIPVFHIPEGKKHEIDLIREIVTDCREILEKIEQGTLIEFNMKLPFKVGGTAYWLNGLPNCIQEYKVLGYIFDYSSGLRVDLGDFQPILFRVFGEKLFASREEAKKRLKELKSE